VAFIALILQPAENDGSIEAAGICKNAGGHVWSNPLQRVWMEGFCRFRTEPAKAGYYELGIFPRASRSGKTALG
jgi:hypothetical protein